MVRPTLHVRSEVAWVVFTRNTTIKSDEWAQNHVLSRTESVVFVCDD